MAIAVASALGRCDLSGCDFSFGIRSQGMVQTQHGRGDDTERGTSPLYGGGDGFT
jgi:hypothetical protein